jgi:hypothetical protein
VHPILLAFGDTHEPYVGSDHLGVVEVERLDVHLLLHGFLLKSKILQTICYE